MKKSLLALAAAIGLAIAAPSFALAHTGDQTGTTEVKSVKKVKKVVKGKKIKLAKLKCAKPVKINGVKRCPVMKGGMPK